MSVKHIKTGDELLGEWNNYHVTVGNIIGSGNNGNVYDATIEEKNGGSYAIKILSRIKEKEKTKRFIKEIETVKRLQNKSGNKYVLPIVEYAYSKDYFWYVMPKATCIADVVYNDSTTLFEKLEIINGLAQALKFIHSNGLAHRDIKPENVFKWNGYVCLGDFGLVYYDVANGTILTKEGEHMGPPSTAAPELRYGTKKIMNAKDYLKSDVYEFSKTVWIILTGNKEGFSGEYTRNTFKYELLTMGNVKGINKDAIISFEPLHELLEMNTIEDFQARPDIGYCIEKINSFSKIIGSQECCYTQNVLSARKNVVVSIPADITHYTDKKKIQMILNDYLNLLCIAYNDISVWDIEQCTYNNNCFIVTDKNNNNHIMNIVGLIIPQEQKKNIVLELDYLTNIKVDENKCVDKVINSYLPGIPIKNQKLYYNFHKNINLVKR